MKNFSLLLVLVGSLSIVGCGSRDISGSYTGTSSAAGVSGVNGQQTTTPTTSTTTLTQSGNTVGGTVIINGSTGTFANASFDGKTSISNVSLTMANVNNGNNYYQQQQQNVSSIYTGTCIVSDDNSPSLTCNLVSSQAAGTSGNNYYYGGNQQSGGSISLTGIRAGR